MYRNRSNGILNTTFTKSSSSWNHHSSHEERSQSHLDDDISQMSCRPLEMNSIQRAFLGDSFLSKPQKAAMIRTEGERLINALFALKKKLTEQAQPEALRGGDEKDSSRINRTDEPPIYYDRELNGNYLNPNTEDDMHFIANSPGVEDARSMAEESLDDSDAEEQQFSRLPPSRKVSQSSSNSLAMNISQTRVNGQMDYDSHQILNGQMDYDSHRIVNFEPAQKADDQPRGDNRLNGAGGDYAQVCHCDRASASSVGSNINQEQLEERLHRIEQQIGEILSRVQEREREKKSSKCEEVSILEVSNEALANRVLKRLDLKNSELKSQEIQIRIKMV